MSDERRKKSVLEEFQVDDLQSKYGMTWSDISTKEDREKWIAGGLLQVIELVSGAVVAERRGYMREPGMGHKQYDRMTWSFAHRYSCPQHVSEFNKDTLFLSKVFPK